MLAPDVTNEVTPGGLASRAKLHTLPTARVTKRGWRNSTSAPPSLSQLVVRSTHDARTSTDDCKRRNILVGNGVALIRLVGVKASTRLTWRSTRVQGYYTDEDESSRECKVRQASCVQSDIAKARTSRNLTSVLTLQGSSMKQFFLQQVHAPLHPPFAASHLCVTRRRWQGRNVTIC